MCKHTHTTAPNLRLFPGRITRCSSARYFTLFVSASFQLFNEHWAPNPHDGPSLTTSASEPPADLSCSPLQMQAPHTPAFLPCTRMQAQHAFASLGGQLPGAGVHARPAGTAKPHQKNCARGARASKQAVCSRQALRTVPAPLGGRERLLHSCVQQSWVAPQLFQRATKAGFACRIPISSLLPLPSPAQSRTLACPLLEKHPPGWTGVQGTRTSCSVLQSPVAKLFFPPLDSALQCYVSLSAPFIPISRLRSARSELCSLGTPQS